MQRNESDTVTLTSHRAKRLQALVHLLHKEGVRARITGPQRRKLVVPRKYTDGDAIHLSPSDPMMSFEAIDPVFERQTIRLLIGIGLLAGFSVTQLLFHWL